MSITYNQWLSYAKNQLNIATADLESRLLLSQATTQSSVTLLTWPERLLTPEEEKQADDLLDRRLQGEPIAYLLGERDFWSLPLKVNNTVLIPRPDTELLVEKTLAQWDSTPKAVLDLGTGSGAIAIALALEREHWTITATDIKQDSLELARQNNVHSPCNEIQWKQSDWFDALAGDRFNLIISNPPYLSDKDPHLMHSDLSFEPHSALVSGSTGYEDLAIIVHQAPLYLKKGGCLMLEHGSEQGKTVRQYLEKRGFISIKTHRDIAGLERATQGCWLPVIQ